VKEISSACRRQGLKFGAYFSVEEWEYPILDEHGRLASERQWEFFEPRLAPYDAARLDGRSHGSRSLVSPIRPLLERLPAESSRAVREAIFAALGSIEDDSVTEAAVGLLASEDSFLRNQAVELLRHRGPRAIQFLNRAFPGADRDERKLMLDALAGVDGPGASEVYDQALADGDLNVVITAVENVGHARKVEFRGRIEQLVAELPPGTTRTPSSTPS